MTDFTHNKIMKHAPQINTVSMVFHWNMSKNEKGKNIRERVYSHDQKFYQVEEVYVYECVCGGGGGGGGREGGG